MQILTFPRPPISLFTAHALAASFSVLYVGSIYLSKHTRLSYASKSIRAKLQLAKPANGGPAERNRDPSERGRDDPEIIRARIVVVSVATAVCCLLFFCVLWHLVEAKAYKLELTIDTVLARLGLIHNPIGVLPHVPIVLLFLGPLHTSFLAQSLPLQREWSFETHLAPLCGTWQGLRNYLVAPITEELVFRACVIAVYHLANAGKRAMIMWTPLWFGIAHVHHAWDTYNRYGRTPAAAQRAIIMSVFQFMYTALFGSYASFLFLRTSSLYTPVIAHVFCNVMGVPQFGNDMKRWPHKKREMIIVYVLGVMLFVYTASSWTGVDDSFYWTTVDGMRW